VRQAFGVLNKNFLFIAFGGVFYFGLSFSQGSLFFIYFGGGGLWIRPFNLPRKHVNKIII